MENHSDLSKNFIPYDLALELKELGFDEECLDYYIPNSKAISEILDSDFKIGRYNSDTNNIYGERGLVSRPLWQQAFDWFRDKYNLVSEIFHNPEYEWKNWKYRFYWTTERLRLSNISDGHYETYEEARLECLKKLIEIIKHDY